MVFPTKAHAQEVKLMMLFHLWLYHSKSVVMQVLVSYLLAATLSPVVMFIEEYVYNDWHFLNFFLVALTVDVCTGVVKHWKKETLCFKDGALKFAQKLFVCCSILVLFHVFSNFGGSKTAFIEQYVTLLKSLIIISYVGVSALENIYEISGGKFPPYWVMRKIKGYAKQQEQITAPTKPSNNGNSRVA